MTERKYRATSNPLQGWQYMNIVSSPGWLEPITIGWNIVEESVRLRSY